MTKAQEAGGMRPVYLASTRPAQPAAVVQLHQAQRELGLRRVMPNGAWSNSTSFS